MAITLPPGVPAYSRWWYYASHYGNIDGCAYVIGPQVNNLKSAEAYAARNFYWQDSLGGASGGAPFNPTALDWKGVRDPGNDPIDAARYNDEIASCMDGTNPKTNHAFDVLPDIIGNRGDDLTWPGHDVIQAWTPGGPNSTAGVGGTAWASPQYVEDCVLRWHAILNQSPRLIVWRMWHEQGNGIYGTNAPKSNTTVNWNTFIANWRKIVTYWRQLGSMGTDALTAKNMVAWCPAAHAGNPGNDSQSFPGTDYVDFIARDLYCHTGENFHDAGQAWYTAYKPVTSTPAGPLNQANKPLIVIESGQDQSDPLRIAKTQEMFDRLTGNHAEPWDGISAWLWWDATRQTLGTNAQMQTLMRNNLNSAYFLPNGVAAEPVGTAPPVVIPTLTSTAATNVTQNSATLPGTVNPGGGATTYRAEYGITTSYGTQSQLANAGSGTAAVAISVGVGSLLAATTYHWRFTASNSAGAAVPTADRQFTTSAAVTHPPSVSAPSSDGITQTAATLHATVTPNTLPTTYVAQYGLTAAYGSSTGTASAGSAAPVTVNIPLTGLTPTTTYHWRVVVTNADGTAVTTDQSFVTATAPVSTVIASPGIGSGYIT